MAQRQDFQGPAKRAFHHRIEKAHALDVGQLDAAQALGTPEVEQINLDRAVLARRLLLLLDAHDRAGHRARLATRLLERDLDFFAAHLIDYVAAGATVSP